MKRKKVVTLTFTIVKFSIFILWITAIGYTLVKYTKVEAAIISLSGAAIYFVIQESERIKGWGCLLGLFSEPFWIYSSYRAHLIGQVLAAPFFVFVWSRGIWLNWIRPSAWFERTKSKWITGSD